MSNTEKMVSVPREHELKIRQTPLADLLSGMKTGEVRDCADRAFASGDTVLLREVDDAREYTGRTARRTITHVQKHFGLPDNLCVLSYGQPAQQHQGDPVTLPGRIAEKPEWTTECGKYPVHDFDLEAGHAEGWNDCLDEIAKLGPLYRAPIAVQGEPVAFHMGDAMRIFDLLATEQISRKVDNAHLGAMGATEVTRWKTKLGLTLIKRSSNGGESVEIESADPGEVERVKAELVESDHAFVRMASEAEKLRAQLAERDALLREKYMGIIDLCEDQSWWDRVGELLSLPRAWVYGLSENPNGWTELKRSNPSAEPSAQAAKCTNEDSWNCKYCRNTESCEALKDPRNFGEPSAPVEIDELVSEDELRDMASIACQSALAHGVSEDWFMQLARSVEQRARAALERKP